MNSSSNSNNNPGNGSSNKKPHPHENTSVSEDVETEEILLVSNDTSATNPDRESLKNITNELRQQNKWKMQRKVFKIHDNKFLSVVDLGFSSSKKFWIKLSHLDPNPVSIRRLDYRLGLVSLILIINTVLILQFGESIKLAFWVLYYKSIAVLMATLGLITLSLMIHLSKNLLLYQTQHGKHPIAYLFKNQPDKKSYQLFVADLTARIEASKQKEYFDRSGMLAAELSELRRLKSEKILDDDEYNKAKNTIFSQHNA